MDQHSSEPGEAPPIQGSPATDQAAAIYRAAFEKAAVGIALLSAAGDVLTANAAFRAFFELRPEAAGRPFGELLADGAERFRDGLDGLLGGADAHSGEFAARRSDGGVVWLEVTTVPIRDPAGRTGHLVVAVSDITHRRETEDLLVRAQSEAASKRRLLAAASHDLRQPAQAINMFVGILAQRIEDPRAREVVGRLEESVRSMSDLINCLLDMSKLDSGLVVPRRSRFPLMEVLRPLAYEFEALAARKALAFRQVPTTAHVHTDRALLDTILRNLLSNAVRCSTSGRILLGCRRLPGGVRIEIGDTGCGIPKERLKLIFEEFYRVEGAHDEQGLGLGLSIVDRLARLLGHRLTVRSQQGRGSAFGLEVPLADD